MEKLTIDRKAVLTIKEAVEYSHIGRDKLYSITKNPLCPFVIYIGRKRCIKRKEFDKYIESKKVI